MNPNEPNPELDWMKIEQQLKKIDFRTLDVSNTDSNTADPHQKNLFSRQSPNKFVNQFTQINSTVSYAFL